MKISYKTDYALKIMLDIAKFSNAGLVRISDISKRQDIPQQFMIQILQVLKGAGLINSKRGPNGGYFLAKPSKDIFLSSIIRLFEGHLSPITCVSKSCYTNCDYESLCPFRDIWIDIRDYVTNKLNEVSLYDMCEKSDVLEGKNKKNIEYFI